MGGNKKLIWYLYPSYLLITLVTLGAATWYASSSIREFYLEQTTRDLKVRILLIEGQIQRHLLSSDKKAINILCKQIGRRGATRFTVTLPSGKVIGDSEENPAKMDNHADRVEIIQALTSGSGISTRYSRTLEKNMMYVALSVGKRPKIAGVIRAAIPVDAIDTAIGNIQKKIAIGALFMAALAALLSLLISRRITRPIARIQQWAESIDRGEFRTRPQVPEPKEIEALSATLNSMAAKLREQLSVLTRQRNEMETVLSSMTEGIIALDLEARVIRLNRAAARMLKCSPSEAKGRSIHELIRNTALYNFVSESLSDSGPPEEDRVVSWGDERFFNIQSTPLRDANENRIGVLIVLNDFTRIRKLENIRREFVANVSHEIKTPITAIKGSVETLHDGAIRRPADADRFLSIIEKHVNRLEVIIEDLLSLSRIEQEHDGQGIELIENDVAEVLQNAIQLCGVLAAAKKIHIDLSCDKDIAVKMDASLLEKAVVNLLNNAIVYSPEGSVIRLDVAHGEEELSIAVHDEGCGIAKEHLPRVFERFYRVDKARSRQLGGTGLGLAIVKHIVEAHGGKVSVESTSGKGSTFTIRLPVA